MRDLPHPRRHHLTILNTISRVFRVHASLAFEAMPMICGGSRVGDATSTSLSAPNANTPPSASRSVKQKRPGASLDVSRCGLLAAQAVRRGARTSRVTVRVQSVSGTTAQQRRP